jgi:hypothetical protein
MEPTKPKISVKDFFLNLGATIALYTVVISLINLLFTVINNAYPKITNAYYYAGTSSISWPVAVLVIFTPILILLMWLLEKQYMVEPERKDSGIHKWLTYLTLFIAGLVIAGDMIMVLYYFIDGQELDTAFLLKCLVLVIVTGALFGYYISDIRGKLNSRSRKIWRVVAILIVIVSIGWGFSVLGSPRTQRLIKYDAQKINDLQMLNSYVQSYYQMKGTMPESIADLSLVQYSQIPNDAQTGNSYEYKLIGQSAKAYELCAEFNKDTKDPKTPVISYPYGDVSWVHPAGHYCFKLAIPVNQYVKLPM